MMNNRPQYLLSEVPNNAEGKQFWKLLQKYKNPRWSLRRRGNGARPSPRYHQSLPLNMSDRFRVYADDQDCPRSDYEWYHLNAKNRTQARELIDYTTTNMRLHDELGAAVIEADNLQCKLDELQGEHEDLECELHELQGLTRSITQIIRWQLFRAIANQFDRLHCLFSGWAHDCGRIADRLREAI
jgi:hypothetical protein